MDEFLDTENFEDSLEGLDENLDESLGGLDSGFEDDLGGLDGLFDDNEDESIAEDLFSDIGEETDTDGEEPEEEEDDNFDFEGQDYNSIEGDELQLQDIEESENEETKRFELTYLDVEQIAIVHRIRKGQNVDDIAKSIKNTGLLEPIVVAPTITEGVYCLLAGYRRLVACAKNGMKQVPCVINNRVNISETTILEAMYNHSKKYSIVEQIDYINYLETEKNITSATMIEYLLQMEAGDYTKLKDILNDNDEDIVGKLYDGVYDIATAFKKLEQRRKKESHDEKVQKQVEQVYSGEEEETLNNIQDSGEKVEDVGELTEEQIANLQFSADSLDDAAIEEQSLKDMVEETADLKGFEPHKQEVGARTFIDPAIKKTVMARDKETCQCCKRGGQKYVDILDYHHILPVFLGGKDTPENGIMLCVACHRLVHLYSTGDLYIEQALFGTWDELTDEQKEQYQNEQLFSDEQMKFKKIVVLGSKIKRGIAQRGLNREQYKKEHPNTHIGRNKPGKNGQTET